MHHDSYRDPIRHGDAYDRGDPSGLPTSGQLFRSTIIAAVSATAILVVAVLPAEYGVDPTGVGEVLGLTQMGRIKMEAERAALDDADVADSTRLLDGAPDRERLAMPQPPPAVPETEPDRISRLLQPAPDRSAPAPEVAPEPAGRVAALPPSITWRDEISITLSPGEGVELKLVMEEGTTAYFEWTANGSVLNFDTHGDGGGQSISYEKGRGAPEDAGSLTAAFTGNHGWFWRNRTGQDVTLTLRTRGNYAELKRTA